MKNKILVFLAFVLLVTMLGVTILGCSKSAEPSSESNSQEQTKKQEVIELTFAHPFPATHHHHTGIIMPLVEEIKEKSNGRIIINVHPGGSITTGTSAIDDISSGAVDMTWTLQGYTAGRFPLTSLIEFPSHFNSAVEATEVLWTLFEESEEFQKEYGDFKVFNMYTADMGELHTRTKPIHTPEDLNGVHLRSASPLVDKTLSAYGAASSNMPMPDVYDALDRGIIDGLGTGPSAIPTYKLHEVLKYSTLGVNLYASPQVMAISWNAWNRLSPEDQELFESLTGRELSIKSAKYYDELSESGLKAMREAGIQIYELTPEDKAKFDEAGKKVVPDYIKELESKGFPGQQLYDRMIEIRDSLRNK